MIVGKLIERGTDPMGQGHYGASRGHRKHNGIDYCSSPGTQIMSNVAGKVTKLGYVYSGSPNFRYVEVTSKDKYKHRFFYLYPAVEVGDTITLGKILGYSQDIAAKWGNGMKNHIHYEIMLPGEDRKYIDPEEYWNGE